MRIVYFLLLFSVPVYSDSHYPNYEEIDKQVEAEWSDADATAITKGNHQYESCIKMKERSKQRKKCLAKYLEIGKARVRIKYDRANYESVETFITAYGEELVERQMASVKEYITKETNGNGSLADEDQTNAMLRLGLFERLALESHKKAIKQSLYRASHEATRANTEVEEAEARRTRSVLGAIENSAHLMNSFQQNRAQPQQIPTSTTCTSYSNGFGGYRTYCR
jgi:hypothetical protein